MYMGAERIEADEQGSVISLQEKITQDTVIVSGVNRTHGSTATTSRFNH